MDNEKPRAGQGARPETSTAADDLAYTSSDTAPQQGQPPDPISILRPDDSPEVREARRRLHRAQAWCAGKAAGCKSSFATDLCLLSEEAAAFYLFADASAEVLNEIADSLLKLLMIAAVFERTGVVDGD